jgi:DNA-binding HxlR family transcriptional regulator
MVADHDPLAPPELLVRFEGGCPVKASLDVLGRKWALLVLRNIGLYRKQRFNEMLRITPGLTKRILAMRLRELASGGFIRPVERGPNFTRWDLTEKGEDALPILMALVHFGSKWYADEVFVDRQPRALSDVFERSYIRKTLGEIISPGSATGTRGRTSGRALREVAPAARGAPAQPT